MTSTNTVYKMDIDRLKTDDLFKSIEQLRRVIESEQRLSLVNSAEELLHRHTGV